MKRFIITFLTILLCLLAVHAQLLWKIEGPGVHTSYIVGTHHTVPPSMVDSIAGLTETFQSAEAVCGEIVMTELTTPEGQQKLATAGMAPADSTLSKVLTPAQCDSVVSFLRKYLGPQLSITDIDGLKPAMLSSTISMIINGMAMPGADPSMPVDAIIQTLAMSTGKPVKGLETIDDQARALFGAPIPDQAAWLIQLVRDEESQMELARRMGALYMAGDLDGLLKLMESKEAGMTDSEKEVLITNRNRAWIKPMTEMMSEAPTLFAVGAGHLPGAEGVLELLRQANLTVTPVKSASDI